MARFYADENFPAKAVIHLKALHHDVLTIQEDGLANCGTSDPDVMSAATSHRRIILTMNRKHFIRLHREQPGHCGIIVCTADPDALALAARIDQMIIAQPDADGLLLRVNRSA